MVHRQPSVPVRGLRTVLILSVIGCSIGQAGQAGSVGPISECMESGRGTYMEARWNLVAPPERLRLCRDQETDRQRADQETQQWLEQQHRAGEEKAPGKAEQPEATKENAEPSQPPMEPEGDRTRDGQLAPCMRADIVGECQATPDQILHQIRRSKETNGRANQ